MLPFMLAALLVIPASVSVSSGPRVGPPLNAPRADGEALIVNSGSTNREGYRLRLYASGLIEVQQGAIPVRVPGRRRAPAALVARFFDDLNAAGRLDTLPAVHCMKSVSFGSTTWIGYHGAVSPDMSCPSPSAAARALAVDANALAGAAGVTSMQSRPLKPL
ncbi:MAG: hypothetical protein JO103_11210 [Candidatus Eremiobacteraeota bacterium]|nr:hypothetical protein [Candidatus Eremiobacteraeota bacterium]MBV9407915.1 hypothetical protein [Candidatus Eremiobacteraeota bacterium]